MRVRGVGVVCVREELPRPGDATGGEEPSRRLDALPASGRRCAAAGAASGVGPRPSPPNEEFSG